ncbi:MULTISPECIES: amidohydrolase family protein [Pseudomonas]|uniref:Amidohydrolase family protein n=1 Tax=Pseudomonas hamedanensis TaxID=2745504 RepID=A0A9E6P1S8_9PSED|nr:amidohydrolase family protein [Pseudomonas hamedanensis]MBC3269905.1 amidohydrolase family protein [Pseudomonas sp. SWRI81]QXI17861.1 amidohydrolase family protein [Pseudomonas hamedanensis]
MKRIGLKASCVVGFDGTQHVLWRDGEVVFEGSRIEFVGRGYSGPVDQWIDYGNALIGPGFIDLDALGDLDSTVLTLDNGDERAMGRMGSAEYLAAGPRETYSAEEEVFKYRYAFTQLIRNGITTAMPITSMYYREWAETYDEFAAVAGVAAELGLRTYLGPCYMSGMSYWRADGSLAHHWDEPRGLAGLAAAERFFKDFDGSHGGLIRGALLPDRIQTCTPTLLQRTSALSRELDAPVRLHCCQALSEVAMVEQLRGTSPLGWLQQLDLLTPRSVLPHGLYTAGDDDLRRLIDGGASLVHCPLVFARDGEALNSFGRYLAQGVNFALGTDTWPADLLENMRHGLNIARLMEGGTALTRSLDLYNAATLGGARALGRDDLGRLACGAKADITVFSLRGLHLGPLFDPLKNLLLAGRGDDCIASYIDGRCVMHDAQVNGVDYPALQRQAQRQYEKLMRSHSDRAFARPDWKTLFQPAIPFADDYSAAAPLSAIDPLS